MNRIFLVATLCLLFVSAASGQGVMNVPATATVFVDCNAGDRIRVALARPAVELTIEITGICVEDVEILRKNVTLRGTSPLTDGIRPAPDGLKRQVITVFGTNSISIENLNLAGANNGIGVNASFGVFVTNCLIEDNSFAGVIAGTASAVRVRDTVITSTAIPPPDRGIWVTNGSNMICTRCTIENHERGILLRHGSEMLLFDSTVVGTLRGVEVVKASRFAMRTGSTIEGGSGGSQEAILLSDNSSASLNNGNINGRFKLRRNSVVVLNGSSQLNTSLLFNDLRSGSSLFARNSNFVGDFFITEFSNVTLPAGSTVSGSLSCSLGADAVCGNPSNVSGTSNCGQCPK